MLRAQAHVHDRFADVLGASRGAEQAGAAPTWRFTLPSGETWCVRLLAAGTDDDFRGRVEQTLVEFYDAGQIARPGARTEFGMLLGAGALDELIPLAHSPGAQLLLRENRSVMGSTITNVVAWATAQLARR